jgi:hypothetical protein
MKKILPILLIILYSCSYSVYSGRFPNLKTIKIERFQNKTTEYNLDQELLDRLSKDFINDGRLKLVEKNPDSVLKGKILKYKNEVYSYENETVKQYRLEITFKVEFNNLVENKIIWNEDNLVLSKIYDNKNSTDLKEAELNARQSIFSDLFQKILSNTLEEW